MKNTYSIFADGGVVGLAHAIYQGGVLVRPASPGATAAVGGQVGLAGVRVGRLVRLRVRLQASVGGIVLVIPGACTKTTPKSRAWKCFPQYN